MLTRVIALAAALILMATAAEAHRVALVIGQSAYPGAAQFDIPVRDAARMAKIFTEHGFEVLATEGKAIIAERKTKVAQAARVELEPNDPETWIRFGETARDAGRTNEAKRAFEQAAAHAGEERDLKHRVKATYRLSDIAVMQGDLKKAHELATMAREMAERRVKSTPDDLDAERELSVCYEKIGDVLVKQGNLPGSLESYRASHAIFERLAKADPGNAGWQHDLSVSQEKIGDVLVAQGNLPAALESYKLDLAIMERLAKADPGNAGWQRDLSVSHNKIGDVLVAQGNLPGSLESYRASLAIRERLVKADPGNAGWQYDLGISNERIGNVLLAQGSLDAALKHYRAKNEIISRLAKADPGNAGRQRDLSVSHDKIGRLLEKQEISAKRLSIIVRILPSLNGWLRATPATPSGSGTWRSADNA